jgi:hypothetical protein
MVVTHLQIPVGEYGSVTVEIEPTVEANLDDGLGVSQIQTATEDHPDVFALEGESGKIVQPLGLEEDIEDAIATSSMIAANAFDRVSETVYILACGFRDCVQRAAPDEASVEFGVVVSGEAGVVIKAKGESSFNVTLTWKKEV